jgi:DNA-directed RNA polymerase specialized sigma24 family protein
MLTRAVGPVPDREARQLRGELMLGSLPAQHREIIIATYFHGQTTLETAQRLGLAPGMVKVRLYQAMQELSDMVATSWPDRAPYPAAGSAGRTDLSPAATAAG